MDHRSVKTVIRPSPLNVCNCGVSARGGGRIIFRTTVPKTDLLAKPSVQPSQVPKTHNRPNHPNEKIQVGRPFLLSQQPTHR